MTLYYKFFLLVTSTIMVVSCGSRPATQPVLYESDSSSEQASSFVDGRSSNTWAVYKLLNGDSPSDLRGYLDFFSTAHHRIAFNSGSELQTLVNGPAYGNTRFTLPGWRPLKVFFELEIKAFMPTADENRFALFFNARNYWPQEKATFPNSQHLGVLVNNSLQSVKIPVDFEETMKNKIILEPGNGGVEYLVDVKLLDTKDFNCAPTSVYCGKSVNGYMIMQNARLSIDWEHARETLSKLEVPINTYTENIKASIKNYNLHLRSRKVLVCQLITKADSLRNAVGLNDLDDIVNEPAPYGEFARNDISQWVEAAEEVGAFARASTVSRYEYFRDNEDSIRSSFDCLHDDLDTQAPDHEYCNGNQQCLNYFDSYVENALRIQWSVSWVESFLVFAKRYGIAIPSPKWFTDYLNSLPKS